MKLSSKCFALAIVALNWNTTVALGDHPIEGDQTIESLTTMALSNSLELKGLSERIHSFEEQEKSSLGSYAPRVSLEAGPQYSKVSEQENTGSAVYGKLDWNLYRGGMDQLSSKIAAENAAGLSRRRKSIENRIRSDVAVVYYEMQFISESIALKNEALALNNEQKKSAISKNKAGFTAESDALEFELREATIMSDVVMFDQSLKQLVRRLSTLIGKAEGDPSLRVKGHLGRIAPSMDRSKLVENLVSNNELILVAQTEQKIFDLEKRQEQSAYYPRIDLETRYGRLGNAESVSPDKNDLTFLLKVSVPIFSGFETSHRVMSKQAYARAKQFDAESEKMHLIEELDGLIETIQSVQKRLDIEEKNLQKSRDYYAATLQEYRRGLKNSPDMVTASERVLEAKIRNLEFRRDLSVAAAKISELTGLSLK